ncbi:MAG: VWA domain-containing protein, partial [Opitutales bacterium]|nr:VWA domain-containing protein [Opitutales bacterium]
MNFHSINWLYAGFAALALLAAIGVWADRRRKRELARFASARLLPGLAQTVSPNKILLKKILFALGVFAVFAALARPQWGYRWEETKSRGIDIIFAIDTSKSMLAEDVKPSRLERAKLSVLDLAEMLDGNRIGIVAFSGQAFLQCPLTLDYDAFRMSLEALDTNVIQRGGTNIAAAISEAETAFAETSNKKVVVLISDGEELESSALAKAKQAAKNGVVIYALGVGGKKGEAIYVRDENGHSIKLRDESGNVVTSKLNEEVLTQIAKETGGFYEPLSASGIETIYEDGLKKIPQRELSARMKQLAIERFQIPLAIAAVLLALEYLVGTRKFFARRRRSGALNIALVGIISAAAVAPEKSEAAEPPAQEPPAQAQKQEAPKPEEKQEGKKTEKKDPTPIDIFNAAIDLSQKGETAKAREMYIEAVKADPSDFKLHAKAYYNIANAEYKSAKNSLAEAESAKEAAQRLARQEQAESAAMASGLQLLEQGKPLLEEEQKALASSKTEDEKKAAAENSPLKKD